MERIDKSALEELVKEGILTEESMEFIESYCLINEESQQAEYRCGRPKKEVPLDKLMETYFRWILGEINLIEAARSLSVAKQTFYNILELNGLAKKDDVRVNNRVNEILTGVNGNGLVLTKAMSVSQASQVILKAIEYTQPRINFNGDWEIFKERACVYILEELGKDKRWRKIPCTQLCRELGVSIDSYYRYLRESKQSDLFKIFCKGVIKNIKVN